MTTPKGTARERASTTTRKDDAATEAAAIVMYGRGWGKMTDAEAVQAARVAAAVLNAWERTP